MAQEYRHELKMHTTPKGRVIPKITASARSTSGNGYTGWGTPRVTTNGGNGNPDRAPDGMARLEDQVHGVAGWATLRAEDAESAGMRHNRGVADTLSAQAGQDVAGWPTTRANDAEKRGSVSDDPRNGLVTAANMAGWPTCTTRDHKDGNQDSCQNVPPNALLGRVCHAAGTNAEMGKPDAYRLNPAFSLWLMGYPAEWASSGALAMQSCRKSPRRSSKQPVANPRSEIPTDDTAPLW